MQKHDLQRNTPHKPKVRVGRGGKRGKTSGRGTKGQRAHGGTPRPQIRDIIKKLPKQRGYRFKSFSGKPLVVNVADLEAFFQKGDIVSPQTLLDKKIIKGARSSVADVKILGTGNLTKALNIQACAVSPSARDKIMNAGGNIAE